MKEAAQKVKGLLYSCLLIVRLAFGSRMLNGTWKPSIWVRARDSSVIISPFFVCVEKLKHFKKVKKTIM